MHVYTMLNDDHGKSNDTMSSVAVFLLIIIIAIYPRSTDFEDLLEDAQIIKFSIYIGIQ